MDRYARAVGVFIAASIPGLTIASLFALSGRRFRPLMELVDERAGSAATYIASAGPWPHYVAGLYLGLLVSLIPSAGAGRSQARSRISEMLPWVSTMMGIGIIGVITADWLLPISLLGVFPGLALRLTLGSRGGIEGGQNWEELKGT